MIAKRNFSKVAVFTENFTFYAKYYLKWFYYFATDVGYGCIIPPPKYSCIIMI